jgi:DNA-binding transcriptional LysR family regulator
MSRAGLTELEAAIAVAKHRNFRAAAAELSLSPTTISGIIRGLEARIGVLLFHRTTRSVSLSSAGEAFINRISASVADISEAIEAAQSHAGQPTGTLRINTSVTAGHEVLSPLIFEYLRLYPGMKIDLITDSRLVDIVLEGFDAGIRADASVPADMVAVPLGFALDFSVIGAPSYLEEHPAPVTPADLIHHRCIRARSASGGIYRWEFERGDERLNIDAPGALILDDQSIILKAAISGLGLGYISDAVSRDAVATGQLRYVLEDWRPDPTPLSLYYPRNRHMPAALRTLVDLIRSRHRLSA